MNKEPKIVEVYTLAIDLLFGAYAKGPWKRVIEIREDASLYELHRYILKTIGFDSDHLFEFTVGKNERGRDRVFTLEDEFALDESEGLDIKLNEVYPITGAKLHYLFDYGDSWTFVIKKSRRKKYVSKGVRYPRVIESEGKNPEQYPGTGW
ncbi:MAG: IS1096 element passenger TnpR family protein [Gammaproteobacteria bacterium]